MLSGTEGGGDDVGTTPSDDVEHLSIDGAQHVLGQLTFSLLAWRSGAALALVAALLGRWWGRHVLTEEPGEALREVLLVEVTTFSHVFELRRSQKDDADGRERGTLSGLTRLEEADGALELQTLADEKGNISPIACVRGRREGPRPCLFLGLKKWKGDDRLLQDAQGVDFRQNR